MPEDPDYLSDGILAWADKHRDLLDLVVAELLRTGTWPTTTTLTRELARQGRPLPLDSILRGMPKQLGFVENHPGRIVLLLFGLRLTSGGRRLLEGFVALLHVALERFRGPDEPPVVTRADLGGSYTRALSEIVLREAPFLGNGAGGTEDDWSREVTGAVVPYWDAQSPDDYLRIRVGELARLPHFGFPPVEVPIRESPEVANPPGHVRDVFISHASEDKDAIARPLAEELMRRGHTIWFDEYELVLGDSLRERIEQGLAHSTIGVVVLSRAFFAKRWPQQELNGLYARLVSGERNVIVPVWHQLTHEDILKYAPTLADLLAGNSADGLGKLADEVERALVRRTEAPSQLPLPAAGPALASATATSTGRPALGAVNFDLETAALNIAALELVRSDDTIALQYLLNEALSRARETIKDDEIETELGDLLDKLVCLAAVFLMSGQDEWFDRVIGILTQIYSMPLREGEAESFLYSTQIDPSAKPPRVWLQLMVRVYALGALAVRHDEWRAVRELTLQRPKRIGDYDRNWLRHALTMVSRASHLQEQKAGKTVEISLLSLARDDIARLACLRPDGLDANDDQILTSLTQFDVLSNIVAVDDPGVGVGGGKVFYPNFARFHGHRVTPVVERLLTEREMREELFTRDDGNLALALQRLGEQACRDAWAFDGFAGWGHTCVAEFITQNLPPAS